MLSFVGIGWEKKLRRAKREYTLSFVKELIIGNALKASQPIFYFLVRYKSRNAVLIFLDGKGIDIRDETQIDLKQFVLNK